MFPKQIFGKFKSMPMKELSVINRKFKDWGVKKTRSKCDSKINCQNRSQCQWVGQDFSLLFHPSIDA